MYQDLTKGNITKGLLLFALPMVAGNMLQQFYNIADTLIVGQVLGKDALAAVGSAYALMTFLTSIFLGLSMGSGALFSIYLGRKDSDSLRSAVAHAFGLILAVTVVINGIVYTFLDPILRFLQIPMELYTAMRQYLWIIFLGLLALLVTLITGKTRNGMGIVILLAAIAGYVKLYMNDVFTYWNSAHPIGNKRSYIRISKATITPLFTTCLKSDEFMPWMRYGIIAGILLCVITGAGIMLYYRKGDLGDEDRDE